MNDLDNPIVQALMRLEQTRTRLIVQCTQPPDSDPAESTDTGVHPGASSIGALIVDWITQELLDRTQALASHDGAPGRDLASGVKSDLLGWVKDHPVLSAVSALAIGGIAIGQRRRLLKWALASAAPMLTSQLSAIALPLALQWLASRTAGQRGANQSSEHEHQRATQAPSHPVDRVEPPALSPDRSPAEGSPA